jgi:predicted transcriptional regulator
MKGLQLKEHLTRIANKVNEETVLEDVYEQLALLNDIEESDKQIERGEYFTQQEVEEKAKEWLK